YARAGGLCRVQRFARAGGRFVAERRRDAGHMEPVGARENSFPVDGSRIELADGRMRPVVDNIRRALACTALDVVDPYSVASANDEVGSDALGSQRAYRRFSDIVRRQAGDVITVEAELREADGHIRLAAAERGRED